LLIPPTLLDTVGAPILQVYDASHGQVTPIIAEQGVASNLSLALSGKQALPVMVLAHRQETQIVCGRAQNQHTRLAQPTSVFFLPDTRLCPQP
uniref:hypothetical protein n=2 Tax=unclassified Pseudomonas TaxID=196821 RepID=UPI0030DB4CAC